MARTAIRLVFVAMLALLAAQAAVPSLRVAAVFEQTERAEARQQTPVVSPKVIETASVRPTGLPYVSLAKPAPDAILFFQLPPPATPYIS